MSPASAAASGPEEQGPTLKLIVEKGPLSGQSFCFGPGSRVQIGRVVRGNSISIKDAGISSKHVLIQFGPNLDSDTAPNCCQWTITDLASSNGTILNDTQLEPFEPSVLSDGDVVKIGEDNIGKTRRNPRRGAAGRGQRMVELMVIDEDSELGLGFKDKLGDMAGNGKDVLEPSSVTKYITILCK
ncbi:FHA domain-containing protein [Forsythia ovata]|uniref:FHA domain-containing protein n=1 Tax=Forsythia ovata TaxID=205694 RepID=A0ABD1TCH8_9LAMI